MLLGVQIAETVGLRRNDSRRLKLDLEQIVSQKYSVHHQFVKYMYVYK